MIPSAFYETKYSYDRGAKRWMLTFTSRELENLVLTVPLVDNSVWFDGENVVCEHEEALGLAFLQHNESVAVYRQEQEIRKHEAAEAAKASAGSQGPLDVPAAE
jgi:hypothetical protein